MAKTTSSPNKRSSKPSAAKSIEQQNRVLKALGDYLRSQRGVMASDQAAACDSVLAEIDKL